MFACIDVCVYVYGMYMYGRMFVWIHGLGYVLQRSGPARWDPDPLRQIWSYVVMDPISRRFEDWSMGWSGDSQRLVQWRSYGNSVPKSRHFMWVLAFISFPYLPLSVGIYILLVSFHVTFRLILPVWLPVFLHETSVSVHFNYVVDLSDYLRHFMYCYLPLLTLE